MVARRIEAVKNADYSAVLMSASGIAFHLSTQLIDALNESYPDSRFSQFFLAPEPLWAWVCSVLDPQDSIKELMN